MKVLYNNLMGLGCVVHPPMHSGPHVRGCVALDSRHSFEILLSTLTRPYYRDGSLHGFEGVPWAFLKLEVCDDDDVTAAAVCLIFRGLREPQMMPGRIVCLHF